MSSRTHKRIYGAACAQCRDKKASCDAVHPTCSRCKEAGDECYYVTSSRRLRTKSIDRHESVLSPGPSSLEMRLAGVERRLREVEGSASFSIPFRANTPKDDPPKYRFHLDSQGNVVYQGLTSLSRGRALDLDVYPQQDSETYDEPALLPLYQAFASSRHVSVDPHIGDALIECYFSHSAPIFNFVTKSIFLRDMALSGPFFSDFLLMTLYASGTRMIDGLEEDERQAQGDLFAGLARELLTVELGGPSKIPTIQGLLCLAGRECAVGHPSQGWNMTGIAFRMMEDLGLQLPWENIPGSESISAEEKAIRDRLYWSAFTWDKTISLALGREPSFPPRAGRYYSSIPDFEDDNVAWSPFFANPANCPPSLSGYMYQPKSAVSIFRLHARLASILHDMLNTLYSPDRRIPTSIGDFVKQQRQRLHEFWKGCETHVAVPTNPTIPSPPSWIVTLLLLYHATWILLLRPTLQTAEGCDEALVECIRHSTAAFEIGTAFHATFRDRMSYTSMYCSFVAATFDVHLLRLKLSNVQAVTVKRLSQWLQILNRGAVQGPSIKDSIHTLADEIVKIMSQDPTMAQSELGTRFQLGQYS